MMVVVASLETDGIVAEIGGSFAEGRSVSTVVRGFVFEGGWLHLWGRMVRY
jgi:hypothetical protein